MWIVILRREPDKPHRNGHWLVSPQMSVASFVRFRVRGLMQNIIYIYELSTVAGRRDALPSIKSRGDFWGGLQQAAGVGVSCPLCDLFGWADLDDFSSIHHGNTGCQITHHGQGVRDE